MMTRAALAMCLVGLLAVPACAAPMDGEDQLSTEGAISGTVRVGTIVETTTALRIRRTPSQESSANILGLLPTGTKVKVIASTPKNGFYQVEVLDEDLVTAIKQSKGWCFGEHLLDGTPDEEISVAEADGTAPDAEDDDTTIPLPTRRPELLTAEFESKNCLPLRDDKGAVMKPTINDFVINSGGDVEYAALGINSDTLPYGTTLRIPEVDAKQGVKNGGRGVLFKVVKTAPESAAPLKVTLCTMASGFLPDAGTKLTLEIVERGPLSI